MDLETLALLIDHLIDKHPVLSGLTYVFSAACMAAFVVYTG